MTPAATTEPDEPSPPARQAQRQLDAYNRGDLEAFVACYAEDVQVFSLPSGQLLYQGVEILRQEYGPYFEANPNLHAELLHRVVVGDVAIDHEHVTGRADGPALKAVALYEVRQDLIQRVWFII